MDRQHVKRLALLSAAHAFYDIEPNFNKLIHYLQPVRNRGKSGGKPPKITLKVIDYFLNTHSKNGCTVLVHGCHRSIHNIHAVGLNRHGRQFYSVFRRLESFNFTKFNKTIRLSLSQLVIFQDLIHYNILEYIENNLAEIKFHMQMYKLDGGHQQQQIPVTIPTSISSPVKIKTKMSHDYMIVPQTA